MSEVACADFPTILHVCRTANQEALKVYNFALGNHLTYPVYIAAHDMIKVGNGKGVFNKAAELYPGLPTAQEMTVNFHP